MKNCLNIIADHLRQNGFDGLQDGAECGCRIGDLMPCGNNLAFCTPGYLAIPPDDVDCEFDFYICKTKGGKALGV